VTLQAVYLKGKQDVYMTPKLDGKRYLVYIHPSGSYRINTLMEKESINLNTTTMKCVLDCEFYKNTYYIFDILYFNGKEYRYSSFSTRLDLLKTIFPLLLPKKSFKLKEFKKASTKKQVCGYINSLTFKLGGLDGIIINGPGNYYSKVFKYKPPELLSIDFKIKKSPPTTFILYVDTPKEKTEFAQTQVTPYEYRKYINDTVVEFGYLNNKFVPFRARPDKKFSNGLTTVKSNYKEITNPSFTC